MKKLFLVIFIMAQIYLFADDENLFHTGEGIITLVNFGSSWNVTFTATAVSERWDENYNPTELYEIATRTIPTIEHPQQIVAYFDLVIDNIAGINPIMALGKYKISAIENGVEQAYFYMDWRTSGYPSYPGSPDCYLLYDVSNNHFLNEEGTQIIDATQQTVWELVPGIPHVTSGLGLFTTQTSQNSHPSLSWNAYNGTCLGYYVNKTLICESGTITTQSFTTSTSWTDNNFTFTNPRFADAQAEYWITAKLSSTEETAGANHTSATGHSWIAWKVNNKSYDVAMSYKLDQNYPNPFNPTTTINYELQKPGFVSLKIYNVLGKVLVDLVNEVQEAGTHEISFNAENLPSGTYIYKIQSGNFVQVRKMVLLK